MQASYVHSYTTNRERIDGETKLKLRMPAMPLSTTSAGQKWYVTRHGLAMNSVTATTSSAVCRWKEVNHFYALNLKWNSPLQWMLQDEESTIMLVSLSDPPPPKVA